MKLRTDLQLRKLGNDYIIIDPGQEMIDMSKVFTLNETAAFLWEELQGKEFTEETVSDILLENYEVNEDVAVKDAKKLIQTFIKGGLIRD
ncbi:MULTISPECIES: PqqD family protein [Sphingobacterium]|uniref:PqqD family protein n=1 Tax=Sphingobacterium TaxID=28453 RepID=UPI00162AC6EF|nr:MULTISPECIES: PqqD family protein [Sphingobacterium]MBV2225699.1 PqqD family protein [Sphingobacterium mizutaii]